MHSWWFNCTVHVHPSLAFISHICLVCFCSSTLHLYCLSYFGWISCGSFDRSQLHSSVCCPLFECTNLRKQTYFVQVTNCPRWLLKYLRAMNTGLTLINPDLGGHWMASGRHRNWMHVWYILGILGALQKMIEQFRAHLLQFLCWNCFDSGDLCSIYLSCRQLCLLMSRFNIQMLSCCFCNISLRTEQSAEMFVIHVLCSCHLGCVFLASSSYFFSLPLRLALRYFNHWLCRLSSHMFSPQIGPFLLLQYTYMQCACMDAMFLCFAGGILTVHSDWSCPLLYHFLQVGMLFLSLQLSCSFSSVHLSDNGEAWL